MTINWNILLHELESGKCVLCIGPDVFSKADDARLEQNGWPPRLKKRTPPR